jgi:hypothetical protein
LVHKLDTFTDQQRATQKQIRGLIWKFYGSLKDYRLNPSGRRAGTLRARFDYVFRRRTGFATLDRLLIVGRVTEPSFRFLQLNTAAAWALGPNRRARPTAVLEPDHQNRCPPERVRGTDSPCRGRGITISRDS